MANGIVVALYASSCSAEHTASSCFLCSSRRHKGEPIVVHDARYECTHCGTTFRSVRSSWSHECADGVATVLERAVVPRPKVIIVRSALKAPGVEIATQTSPKRIKRPPGVEIETQTDAVSIAREGHDAVIPLDADNCYSAHLGRVRQVGALVQLYGLSSKVDNYKCGVVVCIDSAPGRVDVELSSFVSAYSNAHADKCRRMATPRRIIRVRPYNLLLLPTTPQAASPELKLDIASTIVYEMSLYTARPWDAIDRLVVLLDSRMNETALTLIVVQKLDKQWTGIKTMRRHSEWLNHLHPDIVSGAVKNCLARGWLDEEGHRHLLAFSNGLFTRVARYLGK